MERLGQRVGHLIGGWKSLPGGLWTLSSNHEARLRRQYARVVALPPWCSLKLVTQFNPRMASGGFPAGHFLPSFAGRGVQDPLIRAYGTLHKNQPAVRLRSDKIELRLGPSGLKTGLAVLVI